MPKLPSAADLGERPSVRAPTSVAIISGSDKSTAPGLALAKAGDIVGNAGDQFFKLFKQEEQKVNTTKAEEAFNKLRETQLDLTVGPQNGFLNKKGADALSSGLLKDYSDRLEQASKQIEDGLGNDDQKELYRKRAAVSGLQFKEDLLRHLYREGDNYAKQVYDGGVNVEVRNATARWQDPEAVQLSIERINGLVDQEASRAGWSPEMKQAELLKRQSQVHSSVIGQAIASDNYEFAQKWYEEHKDAIDPATAKAVQKAVEDGTQKQLFAGYGRDFLGNRDSYDGLNALEKRVTEDPTLDDTRKNALLGRIASRRDTLENKARIEQTLLEARVKRAIDDARSNLMAGFEPTPDQLAPILNAAKGTDFEADAKALVAGANATHVFRNSLPAAQEQMITKAEAMIRQDPAKFDRRILDSWRTIKEQQQQRVQASPITYAVQQGLVNPSSPAAQPLDLSQPTQIGDNLAARFELGRAMARTHNVPLKPLTPEEVALATNQLKAATVPQKRQWFGDLAQAANGDYEGYSAIMAQLAPDAPVLAIAGEYAGKGRSQAADLLLRGDSILRPNRKEDGSPDSGKLLPLPAEKDMRRIFDDQVRDAFAGMPKARADHFQAARAIYAAMSSDAGDRDTQVLDTKRWEQAIEMATGGFANYAGKRIPLPYGQDVSQFKDGLARRVEDVLSSDRLDEKWTRGALLDLPLEAAGDGKYKFKIGTADLVDKQGNVVKIDFGTPAAFRTSGFSLAAPAQEPTVGELQEAQKPFLGRPKAKK